MAEAARTTTVDRLRELVGRHSGIRLGADKQQLLLARLGRRMRQLAQETLDEYLAYVESDSSGAELACLLDAVTTNVTSFFREPHHFAHLVKHAQAHWRAVDEPEGIRIWSSACSSGQEPFSILMSLEKRLGAAELRRFLVLGTDLSHRMLARCERAQYSGAEVRPIEAMDRQRWFEAAPDGRGQRVVSGLRARARFRHLNLLGAWPMKKRFHAIFCRNVIIYFDRPTQERLVERFHDQLLPGGHLYIGHSESLSGFKHRFEFVAPTIYRRPLA
jgi:chemotaxis protein methyltransferase CheR